MAQGLLQIAIFLAVLIAIVPVLGGYMARVFTGERVFLSPVALPLERLAPSASRARRGSPGSSTRARC